MSAIPPSTACPVLIGMENFTLWKVRITGKLKVAKVWGIISGTETAQDPSPPPMSCSTSPPTKSASSARRASTSEQTPSSATSRSQYIIVNNQESWETREGKAYGILIEYIDNRLLAQFPIEKAKPLWDALIKHHQGVETGVHAYYMFAELIGTHWNGTSPVEEHVSKLRMATQRLGSFKKTIDDEMLGYILLHSLPKTFIWDTFKSATINSIPSGGKISFGYVESRLIPEAMRILRDAALTTINETALVAQKPKKGRNHDTTKICKLHGTRTHSTDECRALKEQNKSKKND